MRRPRSISQSDPNLHRLYRFADFVVDDTRGALLRGDEEIPLRRQAYEMLLILVEHPGELVGKDFLLDSIWGETVVTENSITQCLKEVRHAIGDADLTMIRTISRRGYIFELPVERLETDAKPNKQAAATPWRWLLGAVAVVSITILAWWVSEKSPSAETAPVADASSTPPNSLAVLPFVNMSPDPEISFLADGVSEEILNQLAQIPNFLVIARTSSFTFRDLDVDIATIGQQLNVAHVLEGSVRIESGMARVTAQLVSTEDQMHLWSRSYDRPLDSIFDLQKGIARDVAQQLHVKLANASGGNAQREYKPGAESYEAYLRGQYLMAQRTRESMVSATGEFRKAIELDTDFAAAHAGLAISTMFLSEGEYGDLPGYEALARARPHAERALELDPELAESHAAMAHVLVGSETMEEAFFHFQRAVSLKPNYADGAMWLGNFFLGKGQYEESFEMLERAVRSDPLSVAALWNYCVALLERGRIEEAERGLDKLATLAPNHHRDLLIIFRGLNGQWAQAALASLEAKLEKPEDDWLKSTFAFFLAAMGLGENALATQVDDPLLFELLGRPRDIVSTYEELGGERGLMTYEERILGKALAAAGNFVQALPYLEDDWSHEEGVVTILRFDANAVLALMVARHESGEAPGSEDLVAALQESARRYRGAGMVECFPWKCIDFEVAIAEYLSGDRQSAIELLTSAVDRGFLIPQNLAYLQFLYEDPDLASIFERQRAHILSEQEEFLRVICPENPYADVWQPVAGTCKAYLSSNSAAVPQSEPGR